MFSVEVKKNMLEKKDPISVVNELEFDVSV